MVSTDWEKPVKTLQEALSSVSNGCRTLQFEHRLDPYASSATDFTRAAGDKIPNLHLKDSGVKELCDVLKDNETVTKLDLSGNKIGSEGIEAILDLLKVNKNIEVLYLDDNSISDGDCERLAEKLRKNETLKELSLSGNKITSKGAKALAEALRKNESLQSLWLNRNNIRDGGAKGFGYILKKKNTTLKNLCMEDNKIRERGAKVLAKGLRKNTELETLNLGRNKIGSSGAKYFDKALKKNEKNGGHLRTLVLEGNRMNAEDMQNLEARAESRKVKLQGRTYNDIYGEEAEHMRKDRGLQRMRNYMRYHTKHKYWKQGHFDSSKEIKKRL